MPTAKQSWLNKYQTYYAQTEYNKEHYGKRIKQLKRMLEDEDFLEFLSHSEHKDDILHYLAMKKMSGTFQSERYLRDSIVRKQAKRYVEMYLWWNKEPKDYLKDLEELPF